MQIKKLFLEGKIPNSVNILSNNNYYLFSAVKLLSKNCVVIIKLMGEGEVKSSYFAEHL